MSAPEISVLFFASLREDIGCAELKLRATNLADLMAQLRDRLDGTAFAALTAENVRLALNQTLLHDPDVRFSEQDEVAFLPPVTGG